MHAALVWLIVTSTVGAAPPPCPIASDATHSDDESVGLLYSAAAYEHLHAAGESADLQVAIACLQAARERLPTSAVVAQDLAVAWARLGRWENAQRAVTEARALGAAGPELELIATVVGARRGDTSRALAAAAAEGTWRADLVATALGSAGAKSRLVALLPEATGRAAWGRLVLAMVEGEAGDLPAAQRLAVDAEQRADALEMSSLALAARDLGTRLVGDSNGWQGRLRLRSAVEYATNPGFEASGNVPEDPPFRLALTAAAGVSRSFGGLVAYGALRIDQHLFLNQRERLGSLDLFQWSVAAGLRYPLSADPNGTALGVVARVRDLYGDRFGEHLGMTLEGGPELHLRVAGNVSARLAFYGLKTDFIDGSPPGGVLSAVDRDRVGQRAVLSFDYASEKIRATWNALFLRDQADGEAFDAIGGGIGGRIAARASPGVWVHAGLTGTLREYGPVGDAVIIGEAATRAELRAVLSFGARWAITSHLYAVAENVLVTTQAREPHEYADNVLSLGMEAQW